MKARERGGGIKANKTTRKKRGPLSTYFVQGMIAVAEVTDDVILDVTICKGHISDFELCTNSSSFGYMRLYNATCSTL